MTPRMKWNPIMTQSLPRAHQTPPLLTFSRLRVIGALATVLLGTSAPAQSASPATLSNSRTQSDQSIRADRIGYEAQQAAIEAANDSGKHGVRSYSLAKAQHWLDVSLHEHSRNDRSRFPQLALDESRKITRYLASGQPVAAPENPAWSTPLINKAAQLRPDLWAQLAEIRQSPGFQCAEQASARGEVELVHAGNEFNQQGWRHASPYIAMAEDYVAEAKAAATHCPKP